MVAYSKYYKPLDYTCYDIIHAWDDNCPRVISAIGITTFKNSFKIYSSLFLLTALVQGKLIKPKYWPKLLVDILRSTCFLCWNGTGFISFMCIYRKIFNAWYCHSFFIPAYLASFTAVLFERPSRRKALTVYMLNTVSQIIYNILKENGFVRPIPHGEVLLFSFTLGIFLYFFKKQEKTRSLVINVLRFLLGSCESGKPNQKTTITNNSGKLTSSIKKNKKLLSQIQIGPKHKLCLHDDSCIIYAIKGFIRPFCIGYLGSVVLRILTSLGKLRKDPKLILEYVSRNKKMGLFLGLFACSFKGLNCILRWILNSDKPVNGLICGFIASWSMLLFPAPALASYSFWKLVEFLCDLGVIHGYVPVIPYATELLYGALTAFMFHVAYLHPDFIHGSYWKFLVDLTDKRWQWMNRLPFIDWGIKQHKRFNGGTVPDPQLMSNTMKLFISNQFSI